MDFIISFFPFTELYLSIKIVKIIKIFERTDDTSAKKEANFL